MVRVQLVRSPMIRAAQHWPSLPHWQAAPQEARRERRSPAAAARTAAEKTQRSKAP
jgi:hypothetical protein